MTTEHPADGSPADIIGEVDLDLDDLSRTAAQVFEQWKTKHAVHIRAGDSLPDVRGIYGALVSKLGTPVFLGEDVVVGDREQQLTGGQWTEVRYDPAFPNAYRHSANAQPLHTDGSYYPQFPCASMMCCIANAADGGETVFISADDLVDALQRDAPPLLDRLLSTTVRHARSGTSKSHPVIRAEGGRTLLNWNYYCVDPDMTPDVAQIREEFFEFLSTSPAVASRIVPIKLQPGDAVIWKDEEVLHGRNAFRPTRVSERHLWKTAVEVGDFATAE